MKRLFSVLAFTLLFGGLFMSCEPEGINEATKLEKKELQSIDPDEECPPNDRNCNGIPDDEEGNG